MEKIYTYGLLINAILWWFIWLYKEDFYSLIIAIVFTLSIGTVLRMLNG